MGIPLLVKWRLYIELIPRSWDHLIFTMGVPILVKWCLYIKLIPRSWDHLIFIMRIPILVKWCLYIESVPPEGCCTILKCHLICIDSLGNNCLNASKVTLKDMGDTDHCLTRTRTKQRTNHCSWEVVMIFRQHYSDIIMSVMVSNSPASPLFTQLFIQVHIKKDIKALHHWPLWGEFTGDWWIPRTKGQ